MNRKSPLFSLALALMITVRQVLAVDWVTQWDYYRAFAAGTLNAPYAYRLTDGVISLFPMPLVGYALILMVASWAFISGIGALGKRLAVPVDLSMTAGALFALFAVQADDVFVTTHVHHALLAWGLVWLFDCYCSQRFSR